MQDKEISHTWVCKTMLPDGTTIYYVTYLQLREVRIDFDTYSSIYSCNATNPVYLYQPF